MEEHTIQPCSICGQSTEVSDETELLDGVLCRDCKQKLSPWFTGKLGYTELEEIQQQLNVRANNPANLEQFHPTRKFGHSTLVLVDDAAQTFVVTNQRNFKQANPDLLRLEDVIDCKLKVKQDRTEIGPKLYQYQYYFQMIIDMDHPFLDKISFQLNEQPLQYEGKGRSFLGLGGFDPSDEPEYMEYQDLADKIIDVLTGIEDEDADNSPYLVTDGEFDADTPDAAGPMVCCPWCGSQVPMTETCLCSHCGGPLKP